MADDKPRWVERRAKYMGLSLFTKMDSNDKRGLRRKSFDDADFAGASSEDSRS